MHRLTSYMLALLLFPFLCLHGLEGGEEWDEVAEWRRQQHWMRPEVASMLTEGVEERCQEEARVGRAIDRDEFDRRFDALMEMIAPRLYPKNGD